MVDRGAHSLLEAGKRRGDIAWRKSPPGLRLVERVPVEDERDRRGAVGADVQGQPPARPAGGGALRSGEAECAKERTDVELAKRLGCTQRFGRVERQVIDTLCECHRQGALAVQELVDVQHLLCRLGKCAQRSGNGEAPADRTELRDERASGAQAGAAAIRERVTK